MTDKEQEAIEDIAYLIGYISTFKKDSKVVEEIAKKYNLVI